MKNVLMVLSLLAIFTCDAHENIILLADPAVLAVPVHENNEPLIDLTQQKEIAYDLTAFVPENPHYTKIRKTVYDKLKQAQATLPQGLKFSVYQGYRSLETQQSIFEYRYSELRKASPKMTHEQLFKKTTQFASPVINLDGTKNIPPHSTGGAIDVYLIDEKGKAVDMGILLQDAHKDLESIYCKTDSNAISEQAKEYRRIMSKALEAVGFVNYPMEYWHWSYGDRYWAYQTQHKYALYHSVAM